MAVNRRRQREFRHRLADQFGRNLRFFGHNQAADHDANKQAKDHQRGPKQKFTHVRPLLPSGAVRATSDR